MPNIIVQNKIYVFIVGVFSFYLFTWRYFYECIPIKFPIPPTSCQQRHSYLHFPLSHMMSICNVMDNVLYYAPDLAI